MTNDQIPDDADELAAKGARIRAAFAGTAFDSDVLSMAQDYIKHLEGALAAAHTGYVTQGSATTSASEDDIRWASNVLLEKIAAKFEAHETWDIWRSDAAAIVRSFKHDLSQPCTPAHDLIGHDETMANLDVLTIRSSPLSSNKSEC